MTLDYELGSEHPPTTSRRYLTTFWEIMNFLDAYAMNIHLKDISIRIASLDYVLSSQL